MNNEKRNELINQINQANDKKVLEKSLNAISDHLWHNQSDSELILQVFQAKEKRLNGAGNV